MPRLSLRTVYRRVAVAYGAAARPLLPAAMLLFLPLSAVTALAQVDPERLESGSGIRTAADVAGGLVGAMTVTIGTLVYSAFAEQIFEAWRDRRSRPNLWVVVRRLPLLRLAGVDVLVTILALGGLVLFVVPGVLAFTWFALAAVVLTAERLSVLGSLRRSRRLVRGHFRLVLVAISLPLLAGAVANGVVDAVDVAVLGSGFPGAWLTAYVVALIVQPVSALVIVVLWDELRRRGDEALRPSAAAPSRTATSSTPPPPRPGPPSHPATGPR